jgi:hypothetical protein
MAETTTQAWDWHVELRDAAPPELDRLRQTVSELHARLDAAHDSLRLSREREREALQALTELDSAKPWERRRLRTALRERKFVHEQEGDVETMLARVASISFVSALPDDERTRFLGEVRVEEGKTLLLGAMDGWVYPVFQAVGIGTFLAAGLRLPWLVFFGRPRREGPSLEAGAAPIAASTFSSPSRGTAPLSRGAF